MKAWPGTLGTSTHTAANVRPLVTTRQPPHCCSHWLVLAAHFSCAEAMVQRRNDEIAKLKAVTSRLEAALLDLDAQICIFADV